MTVLIQLLFSFNLFAKAKVATGVVFSKEGDKLFTVTQTKKVRKDIEHFDTVYKNLDGETVLVEEMVLEQGKFRSYRINQKQSGRIGHVTKKGSLIKFKKRDGEKSALEEKSVRDSGKFAIGATVVKLASENLEKIKKGQDVEFDLGLWGRQRTIGFRFDMVKQTDSEIVVEMVPNNFLVRQFVDDIFLYFDAESSRLLRFSGRTNLLIKDEDGDLDELDGTIVYDAV